MRTKTKKKTKKKDENVNIDEEDSSTLDNALTEPIVLQLNLSYDKIENIISSKENENNINEPQPYDPENNLSIMDEKVQNHSSNDVNENSTSKQHHQIICYWCYHNIFQTEYGMPIRYDVFHNSFTMYGSFCSLECVAAYNYSVHMGCDRVWEINSWIQYLGKMYGYTKPIRPAPSRYLLNIFNGPLTIEEFRNCHKDQTKSLVINIPPFIHVSSQMEILNTSFLDNNKKTSTNVVNKKKPITISNNVQKTIEQKMNLEI